MSEVLRLGNGVYERPIVSICIPTLDVDAAHVARAVDAIRQFSPASHEIVIYDCQGKLEGYTKPQNAAMAAARGRYLVAMNDDVIVGRSWFNTLLDALLAAGAWCATPDQTHTDGPQVFAPYCMLWRQQDWEQIGGLDEQFVLWGSDIDLARRLVDAGKPPTRVVLDPPVEHALNFTCREHPELGEVCQQDLGRFQQKWGVDAESEKHRLAAAVA